MQHLFDDQTTQTLDPELAGHLTGKVRSWAHSSICKGILAPAGCPGSACVLHYSNQFLKDEQLNVSHLKVGWGAKHHLFTGQVEYIYAQKESRNSQGERAVMRFENILKPHNEKRV